MAWTLTGARPNYCPECGDELGERDVEERSVPHCDRCGLTLYRNPIPMARATVVDGSRVLLIERGRGVDIGTWALPGGHIEADEPPHVAAARELAEETNVSVDPDDLSLLGTGFLTFETGATMVSINYAAPVEVASGAVKAGDDAAAARFWSHEEILESAPLLRASGTEQVLAAIDEFGG